ncbi:MAG: class III signal peptide-containing protein [Candidatus Diapherotrites archaeon]|jgi:hypothetical protein|uniref:Class III signal peptide-containing protein n=1 Tax=Candidatus Iainarchaeum sp. TaxID=3101447 RepID=A0A8T5GEG6_9ARCH|nr:class III signal peptide-containing protein [Candidatus Diapherotrites archaeon]MBT7241113.1 class III signal peptide-containing protein [Candidatus Diapherotrites archaeon]
MNKRGQGTIEYMLIMAIILVIGLVVVGLVSGFFSPAQGINEQESRLYWASQPLAIIDGYVDTDGNGIFVIRNNEAYDINFSTITIDSATTNVLSGAGKSLTNGQKYSMTITGLTPCTSTSQSYSISMEYITKYGITKNTSAHGYVVFCVPQISTSGTTTSTPGSGITVTGDPVAGALILWDSGASAYTASSKTGDNNGIVIDGNTMCFSGTSCDANIDWNGTDLVLADPN